MDFLFHIKKIRFFLRLIVIKFYLCFGLLFFSAAVFSENSSNKKLIESLNQVFKPKENDQYKIVEFKKLSNFSYIDRSTQEALPTVILKSVGSQSISRRLVALEKEIDFLSAIRLAIQRNPEISQAIAFLASQNSSIDVAKSQYYPQISGGVSTSDLSSGQRGQQLLSLNATQMLYDFGKTKTSVNIEKAKLLLEQANVLVSIDDIANQVAAAMINIERYKSLSNTAQQQILGIQGILNIANLRANAGISSQADPIQAQSYLESARSNLIAQQLLLKQYQQRLRTLLGFDISNRHWIIPDHLVNAFDLFRDPEFNTIPAMIVARTEVEVVQYQKHQTDLSRYPTLFVKGSLNQAINGVNPNNNKDDGFYSSVMFEASSHFYQGGAISAQTRAVSYAEQAARSKVNAVYMDVLDQIRITREDIKNKQRLIKVLVARQETAVRTRELYQEQYKLGTRSVIDLLNAEIAIHTANSELENARYDIYSNLAHFIKVTGRSRDIYQLNHISIQGIEVQP